MNKCSCGIQYCNPQWIFRPFIRACLKFMAGNLYGLRQVCVPSFLASPKIKSIHGAEAVSYWKLVARWIIPELRVGLYVRWGSLAPGQASISRANPFWNGTMFTCLLWRYKCHCSRRCTRCALQMSVIQQCCLLHRLAAALPALAGLPE